MTDQTTRPRRPDPGRPDGARRRRGPPRAGRPRRRSRPAAAGSPSSTAPAARAEGRAAAAGPPRSRVVALVVAITAGVVVALVGRLAARDRPAATSRPTPSSYGEVRLDLPGDQRQAVGEFLSQVPGLRRPGRARHASSTRSSTSSSRTRRTASRPSRRTSSRGSTASSRSASARCPDAATSADPSGGGRWLAARSSCCRSRTRPPRQAWFDAAFAKTRRHDRPPRPTAATTLTVFGERATGHRPAFAIVDGKVAVAGDVDVGQGRDRHQGQRRVRRRTRTSRRRSTPSSGDHVGFVYVDLEPVARLGDRRSARRSARSAATAPAVSDAMLAARPGLGRLLAARRERRGRHGGDRAAARDAARPDRRTAHPTSPSTCPATRHRRCRSAHDIGQDPPADARPVRGDADAQGRHRPRSTRRLGVLGGADDAIGWIGDAGVVVNQRRRRDRGRPRHRPDRRGGGDQLLHQRSRASPRSAAAAGHHRPATRPTAARRSRSSTSATSRELDRAAADRRDAAACSLPIGTIELACAVTDDVVVIGSGPSFVKHVLDTTDGDVARLERPLQEPGRTGSATAPGSTFVDIAAIREPRRGAHGERRRRRAQAKLRERRQAVPRPVRRARRVELGRAATSTSSTVIITVK